MGKNRSSQIYKARQPPPKIELERALRPEEVPAAPPPSPPPRRRRAGLAAALALALAAGAGYGLWRAFRTDPAPAAPPAVARKTLPPPAKLPLPAVIPAALSVTGAPARAARPGMLRHGALRLAVSAPEHAQAYLAAIEKSVWARPVFAKSEPQPEQEAWLSIRELPCILTNLPAGSAEVAIRISGFDVTTPARRVLIPVGATAEVEFAVSPRPATLAVDCNVKHASIALQVAGEEETLPVAMNDLKQPVAEVPALRPLLLNVSAPGYLPQTMELAGLEPDFFNIQKIVLETAPPLEPRRKAAPRYRPGPPLILDLGGGVELELIWIPPGEFIMGSPDTELGRYADEGPRHLVEITQGFWMGRYEVTQAQWRQVMDANPSRQQGAHHPVEQVNWADCAKFLEKLGAAVKKWPDQPLAFALPSEAEWEYACRAGTETALNHGAELTSIMGRCPQLDRVAWYYSSNSDGRTHPVGRKEANAWNLYDMLGNVWEWCRDGKRVYGPLRQTDPEGQSEVRISRGGSMGDYARFCRSAARYALAPTDKNYYLGLRVIARARPADQAKQ